MMKNSLMTFGVVTLLVLATASCSNSTSEEARYFAEMACLSKKETDVLKYFSKARQLDSSWERTANASVERAVYKYEMNFLLQYLPEEDPSFRDAKQKYDRANLIVASECAALQED